jgi:hypothetical protein
MALQFPCHPEVISIHIPKTAGSSFHAALKRAYGWRLKHIQRQHDIVQLSTGKQYRSNKPFVLALHGHVRPHQNWKQQYVQAKWVCWLRDPVDRAVSAYYHLERTQHLGDRNQNLFKQLQPTLEEFFAHPGFKPVTHIYQHFLGAFNPRDFALVGRTEHFKVDLQRIGQLLGRPLSVFHTNVGEQKTTLSDEERADYSQKLAGEYAIYNQFINHFYS